MAMQAVCRQEKHRGLPMWAQHGAYPEEVFDADKVSGGSQEASKLLLIISAL